MRQERKGFTLIELSVVMFIMAILLAIGVVKYNDFVNRQMLRSTAEEIVANLRLAQSNAVKLEMRYAASFTSNEVNINKNTNPSGQGGELFKVIGFKKPLNISFSNGGNVIILEPTGKIAGQSVTVAISSNNYKVYIDAQSGGKIECKD